MDTPESTLTAMLVDGEAHTELLRKIALVGGDLRRSVEALLESPEGRALPADVAGDLGAKAIAFHAAVADLARDKAQP
jgi:hypothetical protein